MLNVQVLSLLAAGKINQMQLADLCGDIDLQTGPLIQKNCILHKEHNYRLRPTESNGHDRKIGLTLTDRSCRFFCSIVSMKIKCDLPKKMCMMTWRGTDHLIDAAAP